MKTLLAFLSCLLYCQFSFAGQPPDASLGFGIGLGIGCFQRQHRCPQDCPPTCRCGCQGQIVKPREPKTFAEEPKEQKPVLWVLTSAGCAPCITFYNDHLRGSANFKELSALAEVKTYTLKNEAEWKEYQVELTPTFRFAGQAVEDVVGYSDHPDLMKRLKDALANKKPQNREGCGLEQSPTPIPKRTDEEASASKSDDIDYDKLATKLNATFNYNLIAQEVVKILPEQKIDYNKLHALIRTEIQNIQLPAPQELDYDKLAAEVVKRLPKQELFYDIKPLPKSTK